jgi:HEAT repeat protein
MNQLLQAGAPEGLRFAEDLVNGKDQSAAQAAIYALASAGSPEAKRLIERALDAKDPSVRVAAISSLVQNPDDKSTDTLVRLAKDQDPQVRATALSSLGQVGSDRAQQAILDATRSSKPEDRIAAISGLSSIDDPRATTQLAQLMRDPDLSVAQSAIGSSYNGGPEVDRALTGIVNDAGANADLRATAASQLRNRGSELDAATEAAVTKLAGPAVGGAGYGGVIMRRTIDVD